MFRRTTRPDHDFQAEIESHLQLEVDRLVAEGMPPAEAAAAARRSFGNVTQTQERYYERNRLLWLEQAVQDVRYGMRAIRKAPAFAASAIITIALGVGANTAIFSLTDAVLLRLLPIHQPQQLVFLEGAGSAGTSGPPTYPIFERLRSETRSFIGLAASSSDELRVVIDGRPEQVMGQVASGNYFELLGVRPALGRLLTPEDEKLQPPVAVISERYWQRRFGGDSAVIGRTVSFRDHVFTIVGVTEKEFFGLQPGTPVDLTLPITIEPGRLSDAGAYWLQSVVARRKPGVTTASALADADTIYRAAMAGTRFPADIVAKHFHHLELTSAAHGTGVLRRRFSKPLYALLGIAGMLLLLSIANIANLLLSRGISRQREFAIRFAAGAGRLRIVRQLLGETVLLFALGAIPGVLLASWGVGMIEGLFQQGRRAIALDAGFNWRVFAFSLALTLAAAVLASLLPAWRAFRADVGQAIQQGQGRASESRGTVVVTHGLVALQVALSFVLLAGSAVFVKTLASLRNVDPGFRNDAVLTLSLQAPEGDSAGNIFWSRVLDAVRETPGVRGAAIATYTPLSGRDRGKVVRVRGYVPLTSQDAAIHVNQVSEGYLELLGVSLLRGRMLTAGDTEGTTAVALLNDSAARHYFGNRHPIGEALYFPRKGGEITYRVVGVVADTKHRSLREGFERFAFLPMRQPIDRDQRMTLLVAPALSGSESALLDPVRTTLAERVHPGILISDVITLRDQTDSTLLAERLLSGLSSAFGLIAIVLACVGLYGVLSYRIGRERQAIGIRMAMGASPSQVARGVLRTSGFVIVAGLLAGLPFAVLTARLTETMLFDVKPNDPRIYILCAVLLAGIGLASAWLPARRASTIAPSEALRQV